MPRWLLVAGGLAAGLFCCARAEVAAAAEPMIVMAAEPRKATAEELRKAKLAEHEEMQACIARAQAAGAKVRAYREGVAATNEVMQKLEATALAGGNEARAARTELMALHRADPVGMALEEAFNQEVKVLRALQERGIKAMQEKEPGTKQAPATLREGESLGNLRPERRELNNRLQPVRSAAGEK